MLNEPALSLHPPGLKDVVFGVLLTPVAPKLLRDRADDRLSVGRLPWCRTGLRSCDGAKVKEGRLIQERRKPMMKDYRACSIPWKSSRSAFADLR